MKAHKTQFIYWFAYYNLDSPSVRYRAKYPLDYLRKHYGIQSFFIIPGYNPVRIYLFIKAYCSALFFRKTNSIIVIQRIHSGFIYASLLKFLVKISPSKTYYDLDDADYLVYPSSTIYHFCKKCEGVFAGSHELAQHLDKFSNNVILNTSPTPDLGIIKKRRNDVLTIGWIGDFAGDHKKALVDIFFPALYELPFPINLVIIGVGRKDKNDYNFLDEYFESCKHINLILPRETDWNNERTIQEHIAEFDIGIATLLDNELHRCKSAFKLKQYMNNGVPVLSTDLPENNYFIKDGFNGFYCSTSLEFKLRIMEIREMRSDDYFNLLQHARQSSLSFNLDNYCDTIISGTGHSKNIKYEINLCSILNERVEG